ncbi:Pirin [Dactylellina cionopaga]|nr:Pirin [Dactylellina cionopaga]
MSKSTAFKIIPRLSSTRGYADHGWLRTYHTFSFANYYSAADMNFGSLRVINEDNIARAKGFDTHHHREFEIFTYITKGEIVHKDSLGNTEVLKRGDVQYTSAGTGISHSEYAGNKSDASILQIWVKPNESGLKPTYYTRHHPEESKTGLLKKIVTPRENFGDKLASVPKQDGKEELIPIPADVDFFASILKDAGDKVEHEFGKKAGAETLDRSRKRLGLVQLVMSSGIRRKSESAPERGARLKVTAEDGSEQVLEEGDGLRIETKEGSKISFESVGARAAEFVFFDMGEN